MITTQRAGDAWSQAGHMASKRVNDRRQAIIWTKLEYC